MGAKLKIEPKFSCSTFDYCEVTDIPYQRFRQWIRKGDIELSIEAQGQGTKGRLSFFDACRAEQYRRLIDSGFKRNVAATFIKEMSDDLLEKNSYIIYSIETEKDTFKIYPKFFKDKKSALNHLNSCEWTDVRLLNLSNLKREVASTFSNLLYP